MLNVVMRLLLIDELGSRTDITVNVVYVERAKVNVF